MLNVTRVFTLRRLWFLAGFLGIEMLLLLSFILVPRFSTFANEDLLAHFAAYCALDLCFLLPCRSAIQRRQIALCFLALAWLTELLQPLTPYHIFDWHDGSANTFGVLVAIWLSKFPSIERWSARLAVSGEIPTTVSQTRRSRGTLRDEAAQRP